MDSKKAESSQKIVGLVIDQGGREDRGFNAEAIKGAESAAKEFGLSLRLKETSPSLSYELAIRALAKEQCDLVISVGFSDESALRSIISDFPQLHLAVIDREVRVPNVVSLLFAEHEGSYLIGFIAATLSTSGTIGFIGGQESDVMNRFLLGYVSGAKKAKNTIKVISEMTGQTSEAWNDPKKGESIALKQMNRGVDIIFAAAGGTNLGVFNAVEKNRKFAIGVDSNQNWIKPGRILTSMVKRVDLAVYNVMRAEKENRFVFGSKYFGLADRGVDYSLDKNNESLFPQKLRQSVENLKSEIIRGSVIVPDFYVEKTLCPLNPMECKKSLRSPETRQKTVQ